MKTNIVLIIIVVIICVLIYRYKYNNIEPWVVYSECPLGNKEIAPNSQVFYLKNRYRKPYDWPTTFESSYPIVHQRHHEQKY